MSASLAELEALYRTRYNDFLRVATALTGDVQSGRDAVHDGFVNAVRSRRSFRREGTLDGWVWRSVVNSVRSRQRSDRSRSSAERTNTREQRSETVPGDDAWAEVRSAVAALPERQRLVLFLRYYADLDYASIAVAAGISPGTVGATLNAAHQTLRERLQEVSVP